MNIHALAVQAEKNNQRTSLNSKSYINHENIHKRISKPKKLILVKNQEYGFSFKFVFAVVSIFVATILATLFINITLASIAFEKSQLQNQYKILNQDLTDIKIKIDKKNAKLPRLASEYGMSQPDKLVTMSMPGGEIMGIK
ncbi:MAG: hypothetical protein LBT85_01395 [Bifidobacteriaceae bacterium]|jgi:hypothetical protein|nr:hypothetical protein [Bifidobacteriaceae bacterium]